MTPLMFRKVLEERLGKIRSVLDSKAGEYARGNDRLHNFKRVAEVKRITPAEACIDGFCKHLVSILDMVDDQAKGSAWTLAIWEEKIGDAINYLILLEALIKEDAPQVKTMAKVPAKPVEVQEIKAEAGMEGL